MARPRLDLGRERDNCPAQFHGTFHAAEKGRCICPRARDAYLQCRRAWGREWTRRNGRRLSASPNTVTQAIDGLFDADQLTTAEKVLVVRHLATVRRMRDREIAVHLHWSPDPEKGRENVLRFRRWHRIPAGVPATHRHTREAVAA